MVAEWHSLLSREWDTAPIQKELVSRLWEIEIQIWWRHQRETFLALLSLCAGNSPVTDEFLAQRQVTRSFEVFFDLRLNKR